METLMEKRVCKECNEILHGRTDQVYCGSMCRTAANNRRRAEAMKQMPECIANIQKTLLNNYRILCELRKRGEQFSVMYLQDLGFSFRYLTSAVNIDGALRCACFDQTYLVTNNAIILLNDTTRLEVA
jgi:hypothetical protein